MANGPCYRAPNSARNIDTAASLSGCTPGPDFVESNPHLPENTAFDGTLFKVLGGGWEQAVPDPPRPMVVQV